MAIDIPTIIKRAHKEALKAQKSSYSPYSKFAVGSTLITSSGNMYSGCNIENASYGGTVCAERIAIFSAVKEKNKRFKHIVIITNATKPTPPCGFCRQVMAEFFSEDTKIWLGNPKGIQKVFTFKEIYPEPFGPKNL